MYIFLCQFFQTRLIISLRLCLEVMLWDSQEAHPTGLAHKALALSADYTPLPPPAPLRGGCLQRSTWEVSRSLLK